MTDVQDNPVYHLLGLVEASNRHAHDPFRMIVDIDTRVSHEVAEDILRFAEYNEKTLCDTVLKDMEEMYVELMQLRLSYLVTEGPGKEWWTGTTGIEEPRVQNTLPCTTGLSNLPSHIFVRLCTDTSANLYSSSDSKNITIILFSFDRLLLCLQDYTVRKGCRTSITSWNEINTDGSR